MLDILLDIFDPNAQPAVGFSQLQQGFLVRLFHQLGDL
jgi:hypothetical protein